MCFENSTFRNEECLNYELKIPKVLNCFQYFDKFLLTHLQNLLHMMQRKIVGRQLRSDSFAPEFHPKTFLFHICGESSGDIKTSRVRGTAFNLSQVRSPGFRE